MTNNDGTSTGIQEALEAETRPPARSLPRQREAMVPGLTVLAHPDPRRVGERVVLTGLAAGRPERLSRLEPAFAPPGGGAPRPLADPHLSREPLRLEPGPEGGVRLDATATRTQVEAVGEAVPGERGFTAAEVAEGVVLLLANSVALLLHPLSPTPPADLPAFGLVGESPTLLALRREIQRVAPLPVPVLLRGESGTGKELVARALHHRGPFVAVNLGAVPPALAAAELFGAARGAFTGADRPRAGYFRRADGGTLFLDEIGELPPQVQPLLLRALESGEVQPVGAEAVVRVAVRLIAATDADLEAAMAEGRFRAPLYHRLAAYELHLPPLRQRRDDVGRLLIHFLRQELAALGRPEKLAPVGRDGRPWLPAKVVARLAACPWPGNVRQLRNLARRLAIRHCDTPEVTWTVELEALLAPGEEGRVTTPEASRRQRYRDSEEVGEEELTAALERHGYRPKPAARELGISRGSLYQLIERSPHLRKAVELDQREIEAALADAGGDVTGAARALRVSPQGLKRRMSQLGLARR